MDTIETQNFRFLTIFYQKLKLKKPKEERLQLLNEIQQIMNNQTDINNCLILELKNLFEREKILLNSNVNSFNLDLLRERQLSIFLNMITDNTISKTKSSETKMCSQCFEVRPLTEFALHTRQTSVNICKPCNYLKVPPVDKSIYKAILRTIRRDERRRGSLASYAFVIQEDDIRHILENIWHGHSILSQSEIKTYLRLPRLTVGDDWAPWNCICLTETEARAHVKINYMDVYEKHILDDIHSKNVLARAAFKQLKEVDQGYVTSSDWFNVGIENKIM